MPAFIKKAMLLSAPGPLTHRKPVLFVTSPDPDTPPATYEVLLIIVSPLNVMELLKCWKDVEFSVPEFSSVNEGWEKKSVGFSVTATPSAT